MERDLERRLRAARPTIQPAPALDDAVRGTTLAFLGARASRPRRSPRIGRRGGLALVGALVTLVGGGAAVAALELIQDDMQASGGAVQVAVVRDQEIAVWSDERGSTGSVLAAVKNDTGAWLPAERLALDGHDPQVAVLPDGSAVAVWVATGATLESRKRTADGVWEPSRRIASADGPIQVFKLAYASTGEAGVSWEVGGQGRHRAWVATMDANGDWQPAEALPSPALAEAFDPKVGVGSNGLAVAVWQELNGDRAEVHAAVRRANGSGWAVATLASARGAGDPSVAIDGNGQATVVWTESDGAEPSSVRLSRWSADGGWSAPLPLSTEGWATDPTVINLSDDHALVAWSQATNARAEDGQIVVADLRGAVVSRTVVDPSRGGAHKPVLAATGTGSAAVAWTRGISRGMDVQVTVEAAIQSAKGDWSAPIPISSDQADGLAPSLGFANQADLVVGWTEVASSGSSSVHSADLKID
jgi:hypothetical protein